MTTHKLLLKITYVSLVIYLASSVSGKLMADTLLVEPLQASKNILYKQISKSLKIEGYVLVGLYKARYPEQPFQRESWWGSIDNPPKTAIEALSLSINGKEVKFEQSMYDYLGNPTNLSIKGSSEDLILTVFGGETAAGNTAEFVIKRGEVKSRKIFLNEFDDDVVDKTTYVRNVDR